MIANTRGFQLLAVKVHHSDHIHVFVSARPKVCMPEMARVLKCNSAILLFEEVSYVEVAALGWVFVV
jgi:REP element-mobilizing transposase RayT